LHSGKDLAVSLPILLSELAPLRGALFFSKQSVSARTSFYCIYASNTIQTGVTRYPSTNRNWWVSGLSSLPKQSDCPVYLAK